MKINKIKFELCRFISTFFYVGYVPVCPGTVASFVSLIITYFLPTHLMSFNLLYAAFLFIAGVISSAYIETELQIKDPSWIVIDEILGMFLTVCWFPCEWKYYILAFILFRFFDISKILFVNKLELIKAPGFGVMLDDVLAAGWAVLVMILCNYFLPYFGI